MIIKKILMGLSAKIALGLLSILFFSPIAIANHGLDEYRNSNMESASNYIFLLVHGTGDNKKCFDKVSEFMKKPISGGGLGLSKVYKYSFKDKFGSIRDWAKELDQWIDLANGEAGTTEAEFVLICHSAGGLAARYYVNNSGLYRGNIKKIVTINTPHLGSPGGKASIWAEKNRPLRYHIPITLMIMAYTPENVVSLNSLGTIIKNLSIYYWGTTALEEIVLKVLDRGDYQLVREQMPESSILKEINSASIPTVNAPAYTIISSGGVPTANDISSEFAHFTNLAVPMRIGASVVTPFAVPELGSIEEKLVSAMTSMLLGYPFFEDGDFVSSAKSQKAFGITSLANAKRIHYVFRSASIGSISSTIDTALVLSAFLPYPANVGPAICIGLSTALSLGTLSIANDIDDYLPWDYMMAHITMKDSTILKEKDFNGTKATYLEHALFDPSVDGSASIRAINQTPFTLSSNLTNESGTIKTLSTYHEVSPEALNAAPAGYKLGTPIVIDGKEKYIESFTVKEPPTRITGVLRDFMPLKMQYFQYSENFAAWKDIKILDEWGNFKIDGLKLTEGQNVIAFQAKNKVGYESNQHLKIIVNTIPQVISSMFPLPNSFTNNNKTTISGEFNKSVYSTNATVGEGIPTLTSAELYRNGKPFKNLLNDPDFKIEHIKVNDYHTKVKFTYTPSIALEDGAYEIVVKAKSEVGSSQGAWGFWVDTTPPDIKMPTLEASSTNKSMNIKYVVSDNISPFLKNITCGLFDSKDNLIALIGTAESVSKGEHFFPWDGTYTVNGERRTVNDGSYYISLKASDQAGNQTVANKGLVMDSSPPKIKKATFSPTTMTSLHMQQKVSVDVNEAASVFVKMKNKDTGTTNVYLANSQQLTANSSQHTAQYVWDYSSQFSSGLKDGLYDVEITAQDTAGNESTPYKYGTIRVDRTPPTIYAQAAVPYVLSNTGANPYTTTLSYRLSEDASDVTVKILNESTGELVKTFSNAATSITWKAAGSLPAGAYQFKIIVEDKYGNTSTAYASCVKDGIAPVISFPANNDTVSGTVAIKGTAMDPDWTNDKPFEKYELYYAEGTGGTWKTDLVEIPAMNGGGTRPMQGNSTLGYFYTAGLKNGTYAIKVTAKEKNGLSVSTTRVVNVYNDPEQTVETPYIKLSPVASSIDFKSDDPKKLSIGFTNSVKPANVHVEIVNRGQSTGNSGEAVVFYKRFPNVAGAPFTGQPTYEDGKDLGYFIWKDVKNIWHIKWSHDGKNHRFSGNIIPIGGGKLQSWDTNASGGIDFTLDPNVTQLMITPKIDEDPTSPQIYASNIYLGVAKKTVSYLPIMIDVKNNCMADFTGGSSSQSGGGYNPSSTSCEWDGKLDTGGYADSGDYIVRVRAESTDGIGISTDEAKIKITTPFEVFNIETVNPTFSTLGAPDRVSVFYNVSKDSNISAYVYDYSKNLVSTIFEKQKALGGLGPNNKQEFYWKGNYPGPNSGTIVTGGNYIIKLVVAAADGSGNFSKEISGITVGENFKNENYAKLEAIGQEKNYRGSLSRLAEGESPFYFEAKAAGLYYPPRDFSYQLTANGKQRFTMYPYVPFAGLMHRGFRQVDVRFDVTLKINGYYEKLEYGFKNWQLSWWENKGVEFAKNYKDAFSFNSGQTTFVIEKVYKASDSKPADLIDGTKPGKIEKAEITSVVVSAGRQNFNLDSHSIKIAANKGSYEPIGRGIFKAKLDTENINGGADLKVIVKIELEDKVPYSRLTNRFIPWYGFVNKNNPQTKDFSAYLTDINRGLGFPGKVFFNDPAAKPDLPLAKTPAEIASELSSKGSWEEKADALKSLANQANLDGYNGALASSAGYDSYLSDEYFEFIPITSPAGQNFTKVNDTTYTAKTDVALLPSAGSGQSQNLFAFPWPDPDSDIAAWRADYGISGTHYRTLLGGGTIDNPEFAQKWTGYGLKENVCFYEIDESEVNKSKNEAKGSATLTGKTIYHKSSGKSFWSSPKMAAELLPVPNHIENLMYAVNTGENELKLELQGSSVYAEDLRSPQNWSSEDDDTLLVYGGKILSSAKIFNQDSFCGKKDYTFFGEYKISDDDTSATSLKYSFLKQDPYGRDAGTNIDNPNLEIKNWDVSVLDKAKSINTDLKVKGTKVNGDHRSDYFTLELDSFAKEKRYVEIKGSVAGAYEIMFFDGNTWKTIAKEYQGRTGTLAWWDVNRLNGKYTVLLKTGSYISTRDINIGTLVKGGEDKKVFSSYRRAQLSFPQGAFKDDQLVTITPVTMTELKIQNRPIIMTHGPIVEIKPSPYKFSLDKRPTLSFYYTFDDLKAHGYWSGTGQPSGLGLNIHQITSAGDLQVVANNKQSIIKDGNGEPLYAFEAPLDHFSNYTLIDGKFTLSAPIIYADRYITNKNTVNIWGTAEPESELQVYVATEPRSSFAGSVSFAAGLADNKGKFSFDSIKLLQEGKNYVHVVSNPKGDKAVQTSNYLEIVKDTVPPVASASSNLQAFSPNGDGKWDSAVFTMGSNEKGKLNFIVTDPNSKMLINRTLSVEAGTGIRLAWGKNGFNLYREQKNGAWLLKDTIYASEKFGDGYYNYTVFSIDEAGNISNNISGKVIIDLTPPAISGLTSDPNPFTPNNDGIKDTTKFSYKLSEPAYTTINIFRDDGVLFRRYSEAVSRELLAGSWSWDGRGAKNELIGGTFGYYLNAEDAVGNTATSESQSIKVDHIPSLLAYAYAEPDPFSPAAGKSTGIKYYLARDNCRVQAHIAGQDGKSIKNLVFGELQNKGEHSAGWDGDYLPGYKGPRYGKDTSKVADGMYEFKVIAQDADGGAPAEVTNTVLVDNTPPTIFLYPVKVDYITKKATVKYNIPEPASTEVSVYDADGKVIGTIYKGYQNAGTYSLEYQKDNSQGYSQNYFRIIAEDKAKNSEEKTTELFSLNIINELAVLNHSANPAAFSPNGDSHDDLTRISYTLSGGVPEYSVTVKILDSANSTVKTIIDDETQAAGLRNYYWGGEADGKKNIKDDGIYQYEITVEDKVGSKASVKGEILTIVSKPTVSIAVDPVIFSPNGDNASDSAIFTYSLAYPTQWITGEASVKLTIKSSTGEAVFTKNFTHSAGTYNYTWGDTVPAGTYYAYLDATDALGTPALTQSALLTVDYTAPSISNITLSNDIFSPNKNGRKDTTLISYHLSKDSYVTIGVLDASGKAINTLQNNQWTSSYLPTPTTQKVKTKAIPTISWDGKDSNQLTVTSGQYRIIVSSKDPAGNSASTTASVEVDNDLPPIPLPITFASYTNEGTLNYRGTGEAENGIEIYNNGVLQGTVSSDAFGNFTLPVSLALGKNELKSYAIDLAGNDTNYCPIQTVTYETTAPQISNLSVSPNPCKSGLLTIGFTASETLESDPIVRVNSNQCTVTSKNGLDYQYTYEVTNSDQQGKANLLINLIDPAGNKSTYADNNLVIDTIPPVLSNFDISPQDAKLGTEVKISFSVSENLLETPSVEVGSNLAALYSQSSNDYVYSYKITPQDADGIKPIKVTFSDLAGNTVTEQFKAGQEKILTIDQTAPGLSILFLDRNPFSPKINTASIGYQLDEDAYLTINIRDKDNRLINSLLDNQWTKTFGSSYTIKWDGKDSNQLPVASNQYYLFIKAVDKAQNTTLVSATIEVDSIPPMVPQAAIFRSATNEATLDYKGTAEAGGLVEIYNDGNLAGTASADVSGKFTRPITLSLGINNLKSRAIDRAGNTTDYCSTQVVNHETTPPVISGLKVSPALARAIPVTISFTVSETLESNPIVRVNGNPSTFHSLLSTFYSRTYTYTYNVAQSDQQGKATIKIDVTDLAGNKAQKIDSTLLVIDTKMPLISNFAFAPKYAKLGTEVKIDFSFSEQLIDNPIVEIGVAKKRATLGSKTVYSESRIDYNHTYVVDQSDPDGITPIRINVTDEAGNRFGIQYNLLVVDKIKPQVGNVVISPDPAKAGIVTIAFNVSETLESDPVVRVNSNRLPVTSKNGLDYKYIYNVTAADPQGRTVVSFEVTDLALNKNASLAAFTVDTIAPVFSNILSAPLLAKAGDSAEIRFNASEKLAFNPDVLVNGNSANYLSLTGNEYAYQYGVNVDDINGLATIEVAGEDPAGNKGSVKTNKLSESFTIDTTNPVVISYEASAGKHVISQPSPFTPNKDGIEDETIVYFTLSEDSYFTLRVHRVDDKPVYSGADFTDSNLVRTIRKDFWHEKGAVIVGWDGVITTNFSLCDKDNNGYADSGKYAFIVEARDRAGNITEKKYGGTVWVQDTILEVVEPDQFSNGLNPDPRIFSPTGNNNSYFYFRVNAGSYPKDFKVPEWISAQAIDQNDIDWNDIKVQGKNVGTYSVKVYDLNGALVRTIRNGVDIQSATLISVPWDGKNNSGSIVSDGRYKIVVDVNDYSGVSAQYGSPFERWIIIDRTAPVLSALSVSNQYISPNSSQSTAVKDTTIGYSIADNFSSLTNEANNINLLVEVLKGSNQAKLLRSVTQEAPSSLTDLWDGSIPGGWVGDANGSGTYSDGIYTYRVTAVDLAGNVATAEGRDLVVDTRVPELSVDPNSQSWAASDITITAEVSGGDSGINYSQYAWSHDNTIFPATGWSDFTNNQALTQQGEGEWYVYLKAEDRAGNYFQQSYGWYRKDVTTPEISATPSSRTWETSAISIKLNMSDKQSGVDYGQYVWGTTTSAPSDGWTPFTDGASITRSIDGTWYLHARAYDKVGNLSSKYFGEYKKDDTIPTIEASPASRDWASGDISVTLSAADAHSRLKSTQYVWSNSSTAPAAGWQTFSDNQTKTQTSDGEWYLHLKAEDNVGKSATAAYGPYKKDSSIPVISPPASQTFNPYLNSQALSFTVSDPSPSSGIASVEAKIRYGNTTIKNLNVSGSYTTSWDGTNNSGDYVNEGTYTLEINAKDNAGNSDTKTSIINIADNQYIGAGLDPRIYIDGNLDLIWINGKNNLSSSVSESLTASFAIQQTKDSKKFTINYPQSVNFSGNASLARAPLGSIGVGGRADIYIKDNNGITVYSKLVGVNTFTLLDLYLSFNENVNLPAGTYYFSLIATGSSSLQGPTTTISGTLTYGYDEYDQYRKSCGPEYEDNIEGTTILGPVKVLTYVSGPTEVTVNNVIHKVSVSSGGSIKYQRGNSPQVKIGTDGLVHAAVVGPDSYNGVAIAVDSSNNAYVAWTYEGNKIYFQKVPSNFAPINSAAMSTSVKLIKGTVEAQSSTVPELISPADGATVTRLRPEFKWKGVRGVENYRINLGKTTLLSTPDKAINKTVTQSEASPSDGTIPSFAASIHEFDEGLDRGPWQWQVAANPGATNEAKSETWSFTIDPPLTISGITNYPNPFNPNNERTKIRYRLGAEADDVIIRIYDLTGSLVRELDGTTNAETSSIWGKYNDVDWDGRNDMGDLVLNGIYPFEIVAKLGGTSVSGRGKIAVLK